MTFHCWPWATAQRSGLSPRKRGWVTPDRQRRPPDSGRCQRGRSTDTSKWDTQRQTGGWDREARQTTGTPAGRQRHGEKNKTRTEWLAGLEPRGKWRIERGRARYGLRCWPPVASTSGRSNQPEHRDGDEEEGRRSSRIPGQPRRSPLCFAKVFDVPCALNHVRPQRRRGDSRDRLGADAVAWARA